MKNKPEIKYKIRFAPNIPPTKDIKKYCTKSKPNGKKNIANNSNKSLINVNLFSLFLNFSITFNLLFSFLFFHLVYSVLFFHGG